MVRKIVSYCCISIALFGCGESTEIKDAVRAQLNDPESAQFKETVISKAGHRACIEWNAKNGFGGYGSSSVAELRKFEGKWTVIEMKGSELNCGEEGFAAVDAGEKAEVSAEMRAFNRLKELGKFSTPEAESDARRRMGACGRLLSEIALAARSHAKESSRGNPSSGFYQAELEKKMAKVEVGDCSQ